MAVRPWVYEPVRLFLIASGLNVGPYSLKL